MEEGQCPCEIPCTSKLYSIDLSYSVLSPESIWRLWNLQPERRLKAEEEYIAATELIQRVDPDILQRDRALAEMLEEQLSHFIQLIIDLDNAMVHSNLTRKDVTMENLPELIKFVKLMFLK